ALWARPVVTVWWGEPSHEPPLIGKRPATSPWFVLLSQAIKLGCRTCRRLVGRSDARQVSVGAGHVVRLLQRADGPRDGHLGSRDADSKRMRPEDSGRVVCRDTAGRQRDVIDGHFID